MNNDFRRVLVFLPRLELSLWLQSTYWVGMTNDAKELIGEFAKGAKKGAKKTVAVQA